ncbi:hypothetical protein [Caldalkalibacillus mannanilyticus]|uniref:hypothetical protein n=1 Tax=Caldalkalibacillus mannanilyticus TaxID=1418 RepID=UPI00046AC82C|nr:hypothetical protein [Caldalkalibacillus mannanilyticus]
MSIVLATLLILTTINVHNLVQANDNVQGSIDESSFNLKGESFKIEAVEKNNKEGKYKLEYEGVVETIIVDFEILKLWILKYRKKLFVNTALGEICEVSKMK